jgi:hypothetical protein
MVASSLSGAKVSWALKSRASLMFLISAAYPPPLVIALMGRDSSSWPKKTWSTWMYTRHSLPRLPSWYVTVPVIPTGALLRGTLGRVAWYGPARAGAPPEMIR